MTPTYNQNSSPPPFPLDDQYNTPKPQASSSSSLSSYVFTYPIQDQGGFYHRELHQLDSQEETNFALRGGSNDHQTTESESDHGLKLSLPKEDGSGDQNQNDEKNSFERMPAKKRLIMRMMKSASNRGVVDGSLTNAQLIKFEDHQKLQASTNSSSLESTENGSNSSSSNSNNLIRVCSDCNTTKTPLWRSGPNGPKSLCNACGIRQRKARRAMAAATAAAANGTILAAETSPTKTCKVQQHKAKRPNNGHIIKKRSKITAASATAASHGKKKKVCFEEFLISLSKNLAFHRVFPQDEKEAAILLMALSCGLVHG